MLSQGTIAAQVDEEGRAVTLNQLGGASVASEEPPSLGQIGLVQAVSKTRIVFTRGHVGEALGTRAGASAAGALPLTPTSGAPPCVTARGLVPPADILAGPLASDPNPWLLTVAVTCGDSMAARAVLEAGNAPAAREVTELATAALSEAANDVSWGDALRAVELQAEGSQVVATLRAPAHALIEDFAAAILSGANPAPLAQGDPR